LSRRLIPYGLAALSLALLAWLVRGHLGELGGLADVSPIALLAILVLFFLGRALGGVLIRIGMSAMGFTVPMRTCLMLTAVTSYSNLILPRSGTAPSALYMRMRHGVPVAGYLSFVVASLLVSTALVGAMGLWLVYVRDPVAGTLARPGTLLLFALLTLSAGVGIIAPARVFGILPERIRGPLTRAHEAWLRLAENKGVLARLVVVQIVTIAVRALKTWVALEAAGADASFADAMLVSLAADIGMLISITPAALGFREGGVLFGAALVGIAPGTALLAAVIDRLVCTAGTIAAGQGVVWWGIGDLGRLREPGPPDGADPVDR
jgi:uncharacterized membrane protein YbhN (UPF0104 family)